jgi:hypothetical protein
MLGILKVVHLHQPYLTEKKSAVYRYIVAYNKVK